MAERAVSISLRRVPESAAKEFQRCARSHGGQAAWFEALVNLRKEAVKLAAYEVNEDDAICSLLKDTGTQEVGV